MPRPPSFPAIQALRAERQAIDVQLAAATYDAEAARRERDSYRAAGAAAEAVRAAEQRLADALDRYHGLRGRRREIGRAHV